MAVAKPIRQPGWLFAVLAAERFGLETGAIAAEEAVAEAMVVAEVAAEDAEIGVGGQSLVWRARATPFLDCKRTQ